MAYEYEDKVIKILKNLGALYNSNINFRMAEEVEGIYAKAKAFDTFLQYEKHIEKYNNSDCHELERVFEFAMKEYMEGK